MITLTPQARSITAFTLAVLLMTGALNRLAVAAYVASGGDIPGGSDGHVVLSLLTVVVAAGVLWIAHVSAEAGGPGWETNLAQAARLIAALGVVIALLATIGTLMHRGSFYGTLSLSF